MSQSSEQVMEALSKLPPFSPVLTKLMASLAKEDVMVNELADWIEKDTVLTGNVLRMVNSAAYGRMGTISSVRHAIAILGTNRLRNIVMGLSVCNMMTNVKLPAAWSAKAFNRHSIAVATMADLIVQEVDVNYPEGAFVAGLLHDVGKLLLAVSAPGEYADILQGSRESGRAVYEEELGVQSRRHLASRTGCLEIAGARAGGGAASSQPRSRRSLRQFDAIEPRREIG
jgi:HD-like signal output (HDOD) protein